MGASTDDALQYGATAIPNLTAADISNMDREYHYGGFRWTNVTIPNAATIDLATCDFYCTSGVGDEPRVNLDFEDHDDAPTFVAAASNISNRTLTGNPAFWNNPDLGAPGWFTSPSVATPLQAVVDRGDWVSGQAVVLVVVQPARWALRDFWVRAWDGDTALAAKLDIDYSGAGFVEGTVSLSGVGSMAAVASLTLPAAVAMSGVGTMVVAGTKGTTKTGAAVLSGVGTMSAAGFVTAIGQVDLSGVGSMAVVGERIVPGAVAMSGVGSMAAIGEVSGLLEGRAELSGVGSMTVVAERIAGGSASFSGVGSMSVEAGVTLVGQASLSGVGSMEVIGETGDVLYTIFGGVLRSIDPADYPDGAQFFLEVTLEAGSGTAKARLYNITDAAEVANSALSTSSLVPVRIRSSALTLASGAKAYRVEYGGALGGEYTIYAADLLVESD